MWEGTTQLRYGYGVQDVILQIEIGISGCTWTTFICSNNFQKNIKTFLAREAGWRPKSHDLYSVMWGIKANNIISKVMVVNFIKESCHLDLKS